MGKKDKLEGSVQALMIAIGILDRVQGTGIYNLEKEFYGWTDKDYEDMLEQLAGIYTALYAALKKHRREDN